MAKLKTFVIKIKIEQDCWHYKKNDILYVPIMAINHYYAYDKFTDKYNGSEYPTYSIEEIFKCDKLLFEPFKS